MNQVVTSFKFDELAEVRTLVLDDRVWFVAKDLVDVLGYSDANKMCARLDADERCTKYVDLGSTVTGGRSNNAVLITERGLYSAIFGSKKPSAKVFKKWVTSEVLPSIRQTGPYTMNQELFLSLVEAGAKIEVAKLEERRFKRLLMVDKNDAPHSKRYGLSSMQQDALNKLMRDSALRSSNYGQASHAIETQFYKRFTGDIPFGRAIEYLERVQIAYENGYEPTYRFGKLVLDNRFA